MHVAHLLRKYNAAEWGGTETVLRQLCEGLRNDGVSSTVFCPAIHDPGVGDPLRGVGCTVRRFKALLPVWGLSEEQRRQMISVGGNLLSFDLPRMLWADRSISVIHTHTLGRIGGIGLTLARRRRIPLVVSIHGGVYDLPEQLRQSFASQPRTGWEWGKPFGLLFRSRRILDEADAILTCNGREAALIKERHPGRRVIVQPHGVSAAAYAVDHREAALAAYPSLRDRDVLLALGRIAPQKNQVWLVEQLPEILRRHPNVTLVLAGACTDEPYGALLEQRIAQSGLADRVLITGKLLPLEPKLVGLLQLARAATLPSLAETFGIVILEAWAAGAPVVFSRTSGAAALIDHGRTGWLFDLERPEAFHESLDLAFAKTPLRSAVIAAGHKEVETLYDTQVIASGVRRTYEKLIEEKHALRGAA